MLSVLLQVNDDMNWIWLGRKWLWPTLWYYLGIFLQGSSKTTK